MSYTEIDKKIDIFFQFPDFCDQIYQVIMELEVENNYQTFFRFLPGFVTCILIDGKVMVKICKIFDVLTVKMTCCIG